MTDLPFLTDGAAPANPAASGPRKCYRHQWESLPREFRRGLRCTKCRQDWTYVDLWQTDYVCGNCSAPLSDTACARCGKAKAPAATVSRVRRASARGFRTSADLAAYLGGQNVDKLGWPWDVQGRGYRIQSKRLADRPGPREMFRLLDAIPYRADELGAVYYVAPRKRLTSGVVITIASEWQAWHWTPEDACVITGGPVNLLEMPLPTFRDLHIGRTDQ